MLPMVHPLRDNEYKLYLFLSRVGVHKNASLRIYFEAMKHFFGDFFAFISSKRTYLLWAIFICFKKIII